MATSGKEAVAMKNAMRNMFYTASAQGACAASSCADMRSILGIIILDASVLLGSLFVLLLSSVNRTARSLPSPQAC